jgi:hypothetical protein
MSDFLPGIKRTIPTVRLCLPLLVLALGCEKDEIRVYQVPKETSSAFASQSETGTALPEHIHWTTPEGWQEVPAKSGSMRVANFSITKEDRQAEASVIPIQGMAGKEVEVVNLWRRQVGLEPLDPQQTASIQEKVQVGPTEGKLFDMVSKDTLINNQQKARILVAMADREGATWFFKVSGEESLVGEQKRAFIEFLKSIQFDASGAHQVAHAEHSHDSFDGARSESSLAKPTWDVPANWQEQPPSQMVFAAFGVTAEAGTATITVSTFPGDVGGTLANVNRWRRQLGLDDIQGQDLPKETTSLDVLGGRATLVDITGTDTKTGSKARMVAAIIPRPGSTWFYKLMGDEDVVAKEKEVFIKFIQTVRYPENA